MEKTNVLDLAKAEIEKAFNNDSLETLGKLGLIEDIAYVFRVAQSLIDDPMSEWRFGEEGVRAPKYAKAIVAIICKPLYLVYDRYDDCYSLYTKEGLVADIQECGYKSIKEYDKDYEVKRIVPKK